ncbi:MAG: type II toxin-antitoxin system PemK/MazF family toxin [Acidimicrobiales bacterium]|nr:type II toxin-antitoxin system PemK/MazF family toxin [Acidimicrobiales bacterium]
MLTSGDIVDLDLGTPAGREAGFRHPAVVITAQRILDRAPTVAHVVPLTSTRRDSPSEIRIDPDPTNGLDVTSGAQCQHLRAVSPARVISRRGNVGPAILTQMRETIGLILDVP